MVTSIYNNEEKLTRREKAILDKAKSFQWVSRVGVIMTDNQVFWDCQDSVSAWKYMKKRATQIN